MRRCAVLAGSLPVCPGNIAGLRLVLIHAITNFSDLSLRRLFAHTDKIPGRHARSLKEKTRLPPMPKTNDACFVFR